MATKAGISQSQMQV